MTFGSFSYGSATYGGLSGITDVVTLCGTPAKLDIVLRPKYKLQIEIQSKYKLDVDLRQKYKLKTELR